MTITGGGNGSAAMAFTGTVSAIDMDLGSATFTPDTDHIGPASVEILSKDQGNNASGIPQTDDKTVAITVNAAPLNSVPGDQTTFQDTPLVFLAGNENLVCIPFAEAGGSGARWVCAQRNATH